MFARKLIVFCGILLFLAISGLIIAGTVLRHSAPEAPVTNKQVNETQVVKPVGNASNANNANNILNTQNNVTNANISAHTYDLLDANQPITRTVNGYSVILKLEYANVNRILLKYSVEKSQEEPWVYNEANPTAAPVAEPNNAQLTSPDGSLFARSREAEHLAKVDQSDIPLVFNNIEPLGDSITSLRLNLVLKQVELRIGQSFINIAGPFAFDFSIPVDQSKRVADVNQSVTTASGDTFTVKKVIATRNDVRVWWHMDGTGKPDARTFDQEWYACCWLKLIAAGTTTNAIFSGFGRQVSPIVLDKDDIFDVEVFDDKGTWTIGTIYFSTYTGNRIIPPIGGPSFQVVLSDASN
jgi:hypothetical protein